MYLLTHISSFALPSAPGRLFSLAALLPAPDFAAVFFFAPPVFAFRFGRFAFRFVPPARPASTRPPSVSPGTGSASIFDGRSATSTVRCAVRFTIRKARPIGAGRIRFCEGPWLA
jgi:hypothetical protein